MDASTLIDVQVARHRHLSRYSVLAPVVRPGAQRLMQSFFLDIVDSTNEEAKRLIRTGAIRDCGLVLAREQSAGKGTNGRSWCSPRDGGIYLSLARTSGGGVLPVTTAYTKAAGVACVDALRSLYGLDCSLRGVNDLFVGGGKLGGILTETQTRGDALAALIVGVGINLDDVARKIEGNYSTTSLERELGSTAFAALDREYLISVIVAGLLKWQTIVIRGDAEKVEREYVKIRDGCREDDRQVDSHRSDSGPLRPPKW